MAENGTTLAKAYVQIMPSAQGIKGNLAEALGGDAASVGQSWGQKLAGSIKGVITAAGIGAALGKTLTEGAALEQSIGGVETLFKGSADRVIAAADNAYRTAGVSANSYMEQVTSFSATLLQGLGGDTEAAASYADKAIVQMADNANKMGTDLSAIQWAYQGFAKDNYTMLDNLKLGYGGTQAEMARLINDSGVLGDSIQVTAETVKDVPFSSIIDAIGVIQDDLGITGTTAQEAATTLSGSFASMKAAASNVLADLTLGRDIQPALNGLAQTVTTFLVGNLLPAVGNILSALPGALVTFVQTLGPQLAAGLATLLPQAMAALSQAGPQMVSAGIQIMQNIGNGLQQGIPTFLAQALPMLLQFTSNLRANFGQLVNAGIEMILNMAQGLITALPTLITYVPQIVSNIAGLINDNAPKLLAAGLQLIVMLGQGLLQAIPTLIANLPQIIQAVVDVFTAFNWVSLGSNIISLLKDGITSMVGAVQGAGQSIFNAVKNAIMNLPATLGNIASAASSAFTGALNGLAAAAASIAYNILNGIVNAITALPSRLLSIATSAISSFKNAFLSMDWASIGSNIINGIISGIGSAVGGLVDAAVNAAKAAFEAAKNFLGINSPSRVMRDQVGKWIPLGIAEGISRNLAPLRSAMQQATDMVAARMPTASMAFDTAARWQPAYAAPGGAVGGSPQTFIFNQPVQTPDEFARAVRVQQTYGLAGGR